MAEGEGFEVSSKAQQQRTNYRNDPRKVQLRKMRIRITSPRKVRLPNLHWLGNSPLANRPILLQSAGCQKVITGFSSYEASSVPYMLDNMSVSMVFY
jgi:hypothetical protein